jgi:hypothetical protein
MPPSPGDLLKSVQMGPSRVGCLRTSYLWSSHRVSPISSELRCPPPNCTAAARPPAMFHMKRVWNAAARRPAASNRARASIGMPESFPRPQRPGVGPACSTPGRHHDGVAPVPDDPSGAAMSLRFTLTLRHIGPIIPCSRSGMEHAAVTRQARQGDSGPRPTREGPGRAAWPIRSAGEFAKSQMQGPRVTGGGTTAFHAGRPTIKQERRCRRF